MKTLAVSAGIFLLVLILIVWLSTSKVDTTSYFEEEYYLETLSRLDSISATGAPLAVDGSLEAGFATVSITPSLGHPADMAGDGKFSRVPLAGFGAREGQAATGIHDSIFVKAVALKVADRMIVLVSADLLIMPPNITDSVSRRLSLAGIQREQVFYSATHTHSSVGAWGAGYVGELFAGEENFSVEAWLVARTVQAIAAAVRDLRPARIATGEFPVGAFTNNRLIGETGTKNNDFSFIAIEQTGHKKAIIGSYSAHATTLGAENLEISADYPGYWARKMEKTYADHALFFAGSVGSQSPAGEGSGFAKAEYIGEGLADSVNAHLTDIVFQEQVPFSFLSLRMQTPGYNIRVTSNVNLATTLSEKLLPQSENVYIQAMRIGNMLWVTTPADFSGEYALQLKHSLAACGFQSNVTSFNGSYVGYIVPGKYFYLDEYEPRVMGWFGPNMGDYTTDLIRQVCRAMTGSDNI